MDLVVAIVNYRTPERALEAVDGALRGIAGMRARVIVVDNDSRDGSIERLRAAARQRDWGARVELVAAERNGGFGYGNNVAIRRALASADPPRRFYLLNPDAVPREGAIAAMMRFLDEHADVGIVGSRIHDADGTPHPSAFRFPSVLGELERALRLGIASRLLARWALWTLPDRSQEVDWVSGASAMIRREVLEAVGLFDENFFLYFEETDLCRRARGAGWPSWYVHEAAVDHERGVATGIKDNGRRVPGYWFASRRYYFLKQGGRGELALANAAWIAGHCLWRARRRIQGKPDDDPPQLLEDFVAHNYKRAARAPDGSRRPPAPRDRR